MQRGKEPSDKTHLMEVRQPAAGNAAVLQLKGVSEELDIVQQVVQRHQHPLADKPGSA